MDRPRPVKIRTKDKRKSYQCPRYALSVRGQGATNKDVSVRDLIEEDILFSVCHVVLELMHIRNLLHTPQSVFRQTC